MLKQINPEPQFPALQFVTRFAVGTAEAAFHLNRKQQTLRMWSEKGRGPLRPFRVHGRLAWPVAELRRVAGETVGETA